MLINNGLTYKTFYSKEASFMGFSFSLFGFHKWKPRLKFQRKCCYYIVQYLAHINTCTDTSRAGVYLSNNLWVKDVADIHQLYIYRWINSECKKNQILNDFQKFQWKYSDFLIQEWLNENKIVWLAPNKNNLQLIVTM